MNWVGGARNRLKLKHENKLQKEFFERKHQQKSNTRTAIPKRMDKMRGKQSQDLFSLEVIMSAHRNEQKRGKGSICPSQQRDKAISKKSGKQEFPGKGLQHHIIPELSPVRPPSQLQPQLLEQDEHGNFCTGQGNAECIFSSSCLEGKLNHETLFGRECTTDKDEMHP